MKLIIVSWYNPKCAVKKAKTSLSKREENDIKRQTFNKQPFFLLNQVGILKSINVIVLKT